VITGRKLVSSNASVASFFIVIAITDLGDALRRFDVPGARLHTRADGRGDASPRRRAAVVGGAFTGAVRRRSRVCRMLGERAQAFPILQSRLAGARLHHSMRAIAVAQRATDMIAMPAKSRFTQGGSPADKQLVQAFIADSYTELVPFRLAVLHAARLIDTAGEHAARAEIAVCKILAARVVQSTALRAIQVHGALGITDQMPLTGMLLGRLALGLADGPTEAHQVNLARLLLKDYEPEDSKTPSESVPNRIGAAKAKYDGLVDKVPSVP